MIEVLKRVKASRLWSKNIYFDMLVTKWADLFPEDVCAMLNSLDRMYTTPTNYREWLKGNDR